MNSTDFTQLIQRFVDMGYNHGVPKMPDDEPEDAGIPTEMVHTIIEEEWATWHMCPCVVSRGDVLATFEEFGITAPATMVEYFLSDCHLLDQIPAYRIAGAMPIPIPSDFPLGPLRAYLLAWQPLIPAGYIPICDYGDGHGPICYKQLDKSVLWFDHELLAPMDPPLDFDKLAQIEQPLHSTIDDFYQELLATPKPPGGQQGAKPDAFGAG